MTLTPTSTPSISAPSVSAPSIGAPPQAGPAAEADDDRGGALVWSRIKVGPARLVIEEWNRIARRPAVLRRVNAWEFMPREVEHLDELLALCGFGTAVDDSAGDHMLWNVVRLAADDDLAVQVVIHRILPALMAVARRRGRIVPGGPTAAMGELLATAWIVVRTYPWQRRLDKVAANLVRDCEYHAFVRTARLKRVDEVCVEDDILGILSGGTGESADIDLDDVLCEAEQQGVGAEHLELLRELAGGRHGHEIALDRGMSPRTIRNKRRAAIDAVRGALSDGAARDADAGCSSPRTPTRTPSPALPTSG